MSISLIVATADNDVIGCSGTMLPWHQAADLQRFRQLTKGHAIIMGRTTYETISRPLPDRQNIIVTRDQDYQAEGCTVVHSIKEALEVAAGNEEIFIIGGAKIFEQTLPLADKIYLTRIHASPEGDAFFRYNPGEWTEAETPESHPADAKNDHPYSFLILIRKASQA